MRFDLMNYTNNTFQVWIPNLSFDVNRGLNEIPNIAFAVNILGKNTGSKVRRVISLFAKMFNNTSNMFEWKHFFKEPMVSLYENQSWTYIAFENLDRNQITLTESDRSQLRTLAKLNASLEMMGIFVTQNNEYFTIIHNNSVLKYCFWNEV